MVIISTLSMVCFYLTLGAEASKDGLWHYPKDMAMCQYGRKWYFPGYFKLSTCVLCHCDIMHGPQVMCRYQECPKLEENCVRFIPDSDHCCQHCIELGCLSEGVVYHHGVVVNQTECEKCTCGDNNDIVCNTMECEDKAENR